MPCFLDCIDCSIASMTRKMILLQFFCLPFRGFVSYIIFIFSKLQSYHLFVCHYCIPAIIGSAFNWIHCLQTIVSLKYLSSYFLAPFWRLCWARFLLCDFFLNYLFPAVILITEQWFFLVWNSRLVFLFNTMQMFFHWHLSLKIPFFLHTQIALLSVTAWRAAHLTILFSPNAVEFFFFFFMCSLCPPDQNTDVLETADWVRETAVSSLRS